MTNCSIIGGIATAHQAIKKTRIIATAGAIADEDAAKDFIAAHSDKTAGHNCWAWLTGSSYRFSDDGEPSGTAGKPILAAIDGQDLDGVVVVTNRWFIILQRGADQCISMSVGAPYHRIAVSRGTFGRSGDNLANYERLQKRTGACSLRECEYPRGWL